MRIATWNLERPKLRSATKNKAILDQLIAIDADLWVLTETNDAIKLPGYFAASSPPVSGYHAAGENFTTVLSRWPIVRKLTTQNSSLSVCVEVAAPAGPCLVYGTIIPYANYRGADGQSKRWVEHRNSIAAHQSDWKRLRAEFPAHSIVVAGDFNQSRDGSGWYEDAESVQALSAALAECELACVTQEDFRRSFGLERATIDHVCIGGPLGATSVRVEAWPGTTAGGLRVSDHNGVVVSVDA